MSKKKLNVHIVGTNGLPANYGGFETLTENLCIELNDYCNFTVYCSSPNHSSKQKTFLNAKLIYLPFKANGWQSIPYDCISILISLFRADIILMLGSSGGFVMPLAKLFKKKIIVNIGGVDWKRNKWNSFTKFIIRLCEYLTIKNASKLVVDNQYIRELYQKEYSEDSDLIPYGGDHVFKNKDYKHLIKQYPFLSDNYCLSVSRAQQDNNIHILLDSFQKINDIKLVVISNWNSSDYGKELYLKYSNIKENIILLDAIYNQEILDIIRSNADLYIHSHSACGTAPSLVEAMWLNLPIFCYDCSANRYSTNNISKYFKNHEELTYLITKYFYSDDLINLSRDLSSIATKKYSWKQVSNSYMNLFREF